MTTRTSSLDSYRSSLETLNSDERALMHEPYNPLNNIFGSKPVLVHQCV